MQFDTPKISAERLSVSLRLRQLLGSDILGGLSPCAKIVCFRSSMRLFPLSELAFAMTIAGFLFLSHANQPEVVPEPAPDILHAAATEAVGDVTESGSVLEQSAMTEGILASSEAAPESVEVVLAAVRADNKTGIFLTAASIAHDDFLLRTIEDLKTVSGTALVFDVKGGSVLFHSAAPMANEIGLVKSLYELPEILALLKSHEIYSIGRFVAIKDDGLTRKLPATRIKHPATGRVLSETWVDPSDDTAIAYNMEVVCELSAMGIDEINLDYIRFSTAEFGALSVYSGTEKADRIEKFIRATRDTIDRCGPKTKLGLSTFAILGWNYDNNVETLGQDVVRFAPLVDIISPMAYPATFSINAYYNPRKDPGSRMYYLVYRTLTGYQELLGPEQSKKLRPWIQGYGVTTKNMTDQMNGVYDAGLCGFTVWNANNAYAPTYSAMKKERKRPERCGS
ncbi:hypothetical protein EXS65_03900 [Candidatus Peribacteria bacterium]|nr:hypothetical protein [Candidatus Peribacteria bacterium]